ncbi:MAG: hypothetical protein EOO28_33105 [Comamonadaceae bacterium]|nr:MAG: hypothetical protein EOO28_33105 [Comamonadaceae bacterium]
MHVVQVPVAGLRPAFWKVAEHLWGKGCDIDSDGNSRTPDDEHWTELTLINRQGLGSVHVDPHPDNPSLLAVRSASRGLAEKVAAFIAP